MMMRRSLCLVALAALALASMPVAHAAAGRCEVLNCAACRSSEHVCNYCLPGYALSSNAKSCTLCTSGLCSAPYYCQPNCNPCPAHCQKCKHNGKKCDAEMCEQGYYRKGGQCKANGGK